MSRAALFKQADVKRALNAANDAGMKVRECIIDPMGAIRMIFDDGAAAGSANPLDRLLKP